MSSHNITDYKESRKFLDFYLDKMQGYRHVEYYHYTTVDKLNNIFLANKIWLMDLRETANDCIESDRYKESNKNTFSLCFSTGTSESLPLWYLYAGIDGAGARLALKRKSVEKLIENVPFSIAEFDNINKQIIAGTERVLSEKDYQLHFRDILYIGPDAVKKAYRIKHGSGTINGLSEKEYYYLYNNYKLFSKGLIWHYEKETRLQVEVVNSELINPNKKYVVTLDISSVMEEMSIRLAPEFDEKKLESLIFEKEGIRRFVTKKIQMSDYQNQIRMRIKDTLCKNCERKGK